MLLGRHFTIGHAWWSHDGVYLVFTFNTFGINFQVQLTHTCNNCLAGFFICKDAEGGVFATETFQSFGQFIGSITFRRFDWQTNNSFWHEDVFESHVDPITQECIPGGTIHTYHCDDVPCTSFINIFTIIGVHTNQAAKSNTFSSTSVGVGHTLFYWPLVNTGICQLAELFHDGFEGHANERLVVVCINGNSEVSRICTFWCTCCFFKGIEIDGLDSTISWARKIICNRIKKFLHSFIFVSRTHHHRDDLSGQCSLTNILTNFFDRNLFTT